MVDSPFVKVSFWPAELSMTTSTLPGEWAGVVTEMDVSSALGSIFALTPPNVAADALDTPTPIILTCWLPTAGPD